MLMDKTDLDLELLCVNPFDVMGAQISPLKESPKVEQKIYKNWDEFGIVLSPKIENSPPSGVTSLEMEKFSDLTEYLPKIIMDKKERTYDDNADELNTPVINKEAFNFTPYISNNNLQKGNENVNLNIPEDDSSLLEFGLENFVPNISRNNNQLIDIQVTTGQTNPNASAEQLLYVNKSSDYELKDQHQETENVDSPLSIISDQSSFYFNNSALSNNNNSVNQEITNIQSNISSPSSVIMDGIGLITPEDSCCSSVEEKVPVTQLKMDPTKLKLNINIFPGIFNDNVNTPDVIDALMNYEDETGLNAANFDMIGHEMNEEEFLKFLNNHPTIKEETTADTSCEDTINSPQPEDKKENIDSTIKLRTPRKRKTYDDDEDYIPSKQLREIVGSDSESEEEIKKPRPRGRPPKRSVSISSDCSKESGDASKYRELRDKNNEASRRSRLKRKQKECELEKEAEILHNRNIQLKAQVSQLEKTVKNFRDSLFGILAKK